jgi:arylsulfatase A-like enzyme
MFSGREQGARSQISTARLSALLLTAAWFGLISGLIEDTVPFGRRWILHKVFWISPHFAWMIPTVYAFLFLAIGSGLFVICRLRPTLCTTRNTTLVLSFCAATGPVAAIRGLHWTAVLLLSIGIAIQMTRLVVRHPGGLASTVRRTIVWLAIVVIGIAGAVFGVRYVDERRAVYELTAAAAGAPNVVLITLDTVRAKSVSLYGYRRPTTPYLNSFAKNGLIFDLAFSNAPWTLPSHATLFTGRYPNEHKADWDVPLDTSFPTIAEVFRAHGYLTAGFAANTLFTSYVHGLSRGFDHYEDFPVSPGEAVVSTSLGQRLASNDIWRKLLNYHEVLNRVSAREINRRFLSWLPEATGRPFFVFLNYFDAHEPYLPPRPFDTEFGPRRSPQAAFTYTPFESMRSEKWELTPLERQTELNAYEAAITYLDYELGRLFKELEDRNVLANTLIIVTADHGEQFGEHGLFSHGNSLYEQLVHVPLVIVWPGHVPGGRHVATPVSLRDVPATILDLLNFPNKATFPGNSFARTWLGTDLDSSLSAPILIESQKRTLEARPWYPLAKADMSAQIANGYYYIRSAAGSEELYSLFADPDQERNLASKKEAQSVLEWFRTSIKGEAQSSSAVRR